ncbi:MAG: diphthamide synthesis protein [Candidatus Pacearchaeota archaeon]
MKTLYIEARKKFNLSEINFSALDNLNGKTISLCATIQYIDLIPKVKDYLEKRNKKVILKKGAFYTGHVLGCNSSAFDDKADILLLIADGKFHAMNNAIQQQREIYVFNTETLEKVTKDEIQQQNKKILAKKKKFLSAKVVGILSSTKYGQKNKAIEVIRKKIEKLGKEVYVFECDNVDVNEFENFPQIEIWINTACFGLARDDNRIINLTDISKYIL